MADPDDEVWSPGMAIGTTDIKGDNEDEDDDSPVKKMVDFKSFGPPPLKSNHR